MVFGLKEIDFYKGRRLHKKLYEIVREKFDGEIKEERKNLGLSYPRNCNIGIKFYNSSYSTAITKLFNSNPEIQINAFQLFLESENRKNFTPSSLNLIKDYFDIARDFLQWEDNCIFDIIKNPKREFKKMEKSWNSPDLEEFKNFLKERGRSYESYKNFLENRGKNCRTILRRLIPEVKKSFLKEDLSCLRHEADHADFFYSPLSIDLCSKSRMAERLRQRLQEEKDESISKEYAKANMNILETRSKIDTIMEIKALFFNYIKPDEWKKANFDDIKKKVYGHFINAYLEGEYAEYILDPLVSVKWSRAEMDNMTSNYLFNKINEQSGDIKQIRYAGGIKPEEVDYNIANKILYEEIPRWKKRFADNGKIVVDAVGDAYKDNPPRLKKANDAKTFSEFIKICKGER